MRNFADEPCLGISSDKVRFGAIGIRNQDFSMDDTREGIETPIYKGETARLLFRSEDRLKRVTSKYVLIVYNEIKFDGIVNSIVNKIIHAVS